MARDGGDPAFHGDRVSYYRAQEIDPGMIVTPSGDMEVDKADVAGAGDNVIGVMTNDHAHYGEKYSVRQQGVVKVRVESGVSAGDELAAPDSSATSGATTPGVAGAGGDTGFIVVRGAQQDDDGHYYALAHLG